MSTSRSKICPRCKSISPLDARRCATCSRKFHRQFDLPPEPVAPYPPLGAYYPPPVQPRAAKARSAKARLSKALTPEGLASEETDKETPVSRLSTPPVAEPLDETDDQDDLLEEEEFFETDGPEASQSQTVPPKTQTEPKPEPKPTPRETAPRVAVAETIPVAVPTVRRRVPIAVWIAAACALLVGIVCIRLIFPPPQKDPPVDYYSELSPLQLIREKEYNGGFYLDGGIRNNTHHPYAGISITVKFFDKNNRFVETGSDHHDKVVPPGYTWNFRIIESDPRDDHYTIDQITGY